MGDGEWEGGGKAQRVNVSRWLLVKAVAVPPLGPVALAACLPHERGRFVASYGACMLMPSTKAVCSKGKKRDSPFPKQGSAQPTPPSPPQTLAYTRTAHCRAQNGTSYGFGHQLPSADRRGGHTNAAAIILRFTSRHFTSHVNLRGVTSLQLQLQLQHVSFNVGVLGLLASLHFGTSLHFTSLHT